MQDVKRNESVEAKREAGFSFIELMVSMTIISALSGISMSIFSNYQLDAYNSLAASQLRNLVAGEEAYVTSNETYVACQDGDCVTTLPGISESKGIHVQIDADTAVFSLAVCHEKGSLEYSWDSATSAISTRSIEVGTCNPSPAPIS